MDIQVMAVSTSSSLDPTREFGILLNKALTIIRMSHWYAEDYNVHTILGNLYDSLDELFDKLQEEIIGTSKLQNVTFPSLPSVVLDVDYINQYRTEGNNILDTYNKVNTTIVALLNSTEFNTYVSSVKSGLNNTQEDIVSAFNKANYLLSMVKI